MNNRHSFEELADAMFYASDGPQAKEDLLGGHVKLLRWDGRKHPAPPEKLNDPSTEKCVV